MNIKKKHDTYYTKKVIFSLSVLKACEGLVTPFVFIKYKTYFILNCLVLMLSCRIKIMESIF